MSPSTSLTSYSKQGAPGGTSSDMVLSSDPRSPFYTALPITANPTELLAARFSGWMKIIKGLAMYFRESSSVQEEIVRQHIRLSHAVQFPFFVSGSLDTNPTTSSDDPREFSFIPFGQGSIQDVPDTLISYHKTAAVNSQRLIKEFNGSTIPRLEDLRRDLLIKIKEIRNLSSDFKNSVAKEQQLTQKYLTNYTHSLSLAKTSSGLTGKQDPYLLKLILDKQIKKQILEENYLHEAFINLQGSGRELEKVVVTELQSALKIFSQLMNLQANTILEMLCFKIDSGFLVKDSTLEWDNFISRDPSFVDPSLQKRNVDDIIYAHMNDYLAVEVKSGYLERRSKYLKSYSRGWYVLTPTFIHEFKSPDYLKDPIPLMSIALEDCQLQDFGKNPSKTNVKFTLYAKTKGISHRGHNWSFKADSYDSMMEWYKDLKNLSESSSRDNRADYISRKLRSSGITNKKIIQVQQQQNGIGSRSSLDIPKIDIQDSSSHRSHHYSQSVPHVKTPEIEYQNLNQIQGQNQNQNQNQIQKYPNFQNSNQNARQNSNTNLNQNQIQNLNQKVNVANMMLSRHDSLRTPTNRSISQNSNSQYIQPNQPLQPQLQSQLQAQFQSQSQLQNDRTSPISKIDQPYPMYPKHRSLNIPSSQNSQYHQQLQYDLPFQSQSHIQPDGYYSQSINNDNIKETETESNAIDSRAYSLRDSYPTGSNINGNGNLNGAAGMGFPNNKRHFTNSSNVEDGSTLYEDTPIIGNGEFRKRQQQQHQNQQQQNQQNQQQQLGGQVRQNSIGGDYQGQYW